MGLANVVYVLNIEGRLSSLVFHWLWTLRL